MKTILAIVLVSTSVNICAQDTGKTNPASPVQDRAPQIQSERMVMIPLELSGLLLNPYRCDRDENIYYRRVGLDDGLRDPIKRVDVRGELKATYDIQQAGSDFYAVDYFVSAELSRPQTGGVLRNSCGIETGYGEVYLSFYFCAHSGNGIESEHSTNHS